jgi:hypothetical protein
VGAHADGVKCTEWLESKGACWHARQVLLLRWHLHTVIARHVTLQQTAAKCRTATSVVTLTFVCCRVPHVQLH